MFQQPIPIQLSVQRDCRFSTSTAGGVLEVHLVVCWQQLVVDTI